MNEIKNPLVFDLSTEGLEPTRHRIVGITCKSNVEERIFTRRDEKDMLIEFWEYIRANGFDKLIGFNSEEFDLPFLIIRSMKYKVSIIELTDKSIDLRKIMFQGKDRSKGKLREFQEMLGIQFPESRYCKSNMSLLWAIGDLPNLREFLLQDVKITWQLYTHSRMVGLI